MKMGCGSRLLSCSCAAVAGSVSDERRGKVVVVGAAVRSVFGGVDAGCWRRGDGE